MSVHAYLGIVYFHNYCTFIIRGPSTEGLETKLQNYCVLESLRQALQNVLCIFDFISVYKTFPPFGFFSNFLKLIGRWSDLHQNSHTAARDGDEILICWIVAVISELSSVASLVFLKLTYISWQQCPTLTKLNTHRPQGILRMHTKLYQNCSYRGHYKLTILYNSIPI